VTCWVGGAPGGIRTPDLLIRSRRRAVRAGPWEAGASNLWPGRSWFVRLSPCHWVPEWAPLAFHRLGDFKLGHRSWSTTRTSLLAASQDVTKIADERDALVCFYGSPLSTGSIGRSPDRVNLRHVRLRQWVMKGTRVRELGW
jgi:hypothetical protein